ncbi:metal/formaldehyde-sensitive transcriptional repressor [Pseudomonas aeruginosa]|uniref:metal/formaldehyde-sensitive transcriptional repressor n=3 Tax=Pseudomonas aeruginosa TaxID=287 RepID=UPI003D0889D9
MAHTIHGKKKLLARVRRIAGQTRALEQALEEGSECAAVLQQIAAIRGAVNGLMNEVLEGHIREHLGAEQASAVPGGPGRLPRRRLAAALVKLA